LFELKRTFSRRFRASVTGRVRSVATGRDRPGSVIGCSKARSLEWLLRIRHPPVDAQAISQAPLVVSGGVHAVAEKKHVGVSSDKNRLADTIAKLVRNKAG
jgi:hypothetical protein